MKKTFIAFIIFLLVISITTGCGRIQPENYPEKIEVMISAAASLTDALTDIKQAFEAINPNIKLTYNFGGSGQLAQQIEQGAPVDVFLSASDQFMNEVENNNLTIKKSRINVASNEMVLITQENKMKEISSFEEIKNIQGNLSIGDPDSVPAGKYAKDILTYLNIWDDLKNKTVFAKNVRQVLAYVETGNADYGIVYSSDAFISNKVKVIAISVPSWHKPIEYPGVILKSSKNVDASQKFLQYLTSNKGKKILAKYGFR